MNIQNHSIKLASAILLLGYIQPALAERADQFETGVLQLEQIMVVAEVKAEEVWELKESGRIMPLEDLISQVHSEYPGRIIEVKLDDDDGRYVYELELVDENGVVWDLEVDASTGQVLKYEQDDQTE
jgi:uncharacterized membrane protein YkoI